MNNKLNEKVILYKVIFNGDFENSNLFCLDEDYFEEWGIKKVAAEDMFDSYEEALKLKNNYIDEYENWLINLINMKSEGKQIIGNESWTTLISRQEELVEKAKQTKIVKLEITTKIMED